MAQDWKSRLGVVYSTNPDFKYTQEQEEETETPSLEPEKQKLTVSIDRKGRSGKQVTLISGFSGREEDLQTLEKLLKRKCGTGGSSKDGEILIQGDMRDKIVEILKKEGYTRTKRGN